MAACYHCSMITYVHDKPNYELNDEDSRHQSVSQLLRSASSCPSCAFLVQLFKEDDVIARGVEEDNAGKPTNVYITTEWYAQAGDVHREKYANLKVIMITAGIHKRAHAPEPSWEILGKRKFLLSTNRTENVKRPIWKKSSPTINERIPLIHDWISECSAKHSTIGCSEGLPEWPNRVIEIAESGERQYCRLIAPNKCELEFMPYLALSHCWGKAATPTKTTMASLASHRERIPLAALPRTFRDAIDVANALNISYIWIDSLCIVQDDPEDWEREAARMASIYRNSYLTIAAVSAHNSSEGLFLDNPGSTKFIDDPFDSDKGRRVYLLPFTRGASKDSDPTHFWPLTSRAWTLQECLLSPRLLCFARDQIYWRCSRTFLSEDGTFQRHSSAALIHAEPEKSRLPLAGLLASYSPSDAFDIWCRWFSEYVERQLTIAEDRLPAWAGITWYYHTATGYTPLVGCWKEDLASYLMIQPDLEPGSDLEYYEGLPSWSWMSFRVQRFSSFTGFERESTVYGPQCTQVIPATELEWRKYDAVLLDSDIQWTGEPLVSKLIKAELSFRARIMRLGFSDGVLTPATPLFQPEDNNFVYKLFGKEPIPSIEVIALCLATSGNPRLSFPLLHLLLLTPVSGKTHTYRRIGLANAYCFDYDPTLDRYSLDDSDWEYDGRYESEAEGPKPQLADSDIGRPSPQANTEIEGTKSDASSMDDNNVKPRYVRPTRRHTRRSPYSVERLSQFDEVTLTLE